MSDFNKKDLELIYDQLNEGRVQKALQLIHGFEQEKSFTKKDKLNFLFIKAFAYHMAGSFKKSLKNAENLYMESKRIDYILGMANARLIEVFSTWHMDFSISYSDKVWGKLRSLILEADNLIESISDESQKGVDHSKAWLNVAKGLSYYELGKNDLSLKHCNKALELYEKEKSLTVYIPFNLVVIGANYQSKSEYDLALKHLNRSLKLYKGSSALINQHKGNSYRFLGQIYKDQGKWDLARDNFLQALENGTKAKEAFVIHAGWIYIWLIQLALNKKSIDEAQVYLEQFNEYNTMHNNVIDHLYHISKARVLKETMKIQNLAEAERLLEQVLETSTSNLYYYIELITIINLCNIYFIELRINEDVEILNKIEKLITRLLKFAEEKGTNFILASTKLLQGKLALIQLKIDKARQFLTEAQKLADKQGMHRLAYSISKEHDKLLEQIKTWEILKERNAPMRERMELAPIEGSMDHILEKGALEQPEFVDEEPVLLIVMTRDGVAHFTYSFIEEWDSDWLFSSFISAFDTFSAQLFAESIDRIKIGKNIILINPIEPFLVIYVIKGESYLGLQKLNRFSNAIKNDEEIWKTFNRALKTGEVLEFNNPPSLGEVVNEIFTK
jgi:tetratricopeptide (TPR) repeat protein